MKKVIESHERLIKIGRKKYWIFVDECKTIWDCTLKSGREIYGEMDYKKSKHKTLDDVCNVFTDDMIKRIENLKKYKL